VISPRLVGRERELLELSSAVEQAKGGSGGAMIVAGPPGIGKTRLATELTTNAHADGVGVHWGRCWEGNVAPAFWPWVQVLRSIEADDGASPTRLTDALALIGPGSRASEDRAATTADGFVVFDQLASALSVVARAAPTVVVIDDLQWADASSLQAFVHMATTATSCPLLLIATLRSTDEASRSDLAELVRLAPRVELSSLSDSEVGELLTVALGEQPGELLLDRVRDACGGNPFYVRAVAEAARHGDVDAFPASIRGVVLGQLAALDQSTRSRIAVASVLGHEFATAALASIDDTDMATVLEAIAHAERAGLVRAISYGTRYAFVHDLVREAIYGDLPVIERADIHLRAAADLADHVDDFDVAARAHHALAALPLGERADAVALATAAGDRARDRLAFDEAARWYRQAHDAGSEDAAIGPMARAELLLAEGSALRSVLSPRAEDVLAEAAAAAHAMNDTELLKRVVVTWTYRHGGASLFGPGLRPWVDQVLTAPSQRDMALQARVLGAAAIVAWPADPSRAWELLATAKEIAASAADDRASLDVAIAELHIFSHLVPSSRSWAEQARLIGEHVEGLARRSRDAGALADALSWRAEIALRIGDVSAAELALTELEIAPLGPAVVGQIMASVHRGAIAGLSADLAALRAATAPARRLAAAIDTTDMPLVMMEVANRYVFGRDDPADLEAAFAAASSRAQGRSPPAAWVSVVRSMIAALAAENGELERAQKLLPNDGPLALRWGGTFGGISAVFFSEVAAACVLPELADATYRWLEPAAGQFMYNAGMWTVFGSADHFLGRCASALGRLDDAERHFTTALGIEQRVDAPHLQARSHYRLAELEVLGDDQRARHLDACLALCDRYDLAYRRSCAEALVAPRRKPPEATASGNRTLNRMVREGDVWTVTFDARTVRLKDAKGIRLLARLLAEPGHEIHALDLAGAPGLVGGDGGEPVLDAAAKESYRRRLSDLAEDVDEARRDNDPERAARAEAEIDALTDQLAAAVGVGGRDRRAMSQSERARVAATRNLRAVIQRAADVHPSLGRHLQMTIRTGTYCSYQPDPRVPVNWTVD
jgi:tetratricopeptide (TPR) repeat protein